MKKFKQTYIKNEYLFRNTGVTPQDLLSLRYGLRPIARVGVAPHNLPLFRKICSKLGFYSMLADISKDRFGPSIQNLICYLSLSKNRLKEYYSAEKEYSISEPLLGKYLGYPDCCVKQFSKNLTKNKNLNGPIRTLRNTLGAPDFRLNHLYRFDSRSFSHDKFNLISPSYRLNPYYLIPHIPCSLDCKNSIDYAQRLLTILEKIFPEYCEKLVFFLKNPVLYFNDFVFFPLLNAEWRKHCLNYGSFIKIHDRLPGTIISSIAQADRVAKRIDGGLSIYKGKTLILKLPNTARLFLFV